MTEQPTDHKEPLMILMFLVFFGVIYLEIKELKIQPEAGKCIMQIDNATILEK